MSRFKKTERRRGVALLVVLLLLATMSALMVALIDDMIFAARRVSNASARDQAGWHALALEEIARLAIRRAWMADQARATPDALWARERVEFLLDEGAVSGRIRDAGKCFNLNSLVAGAPGAYEANPIGAAMFRDLIMALDIGAAEAIELTGALTDWIDSDDAPERLGAEDYQYALLDPPYRVANRPVADITELRAVKGFSEGVYRRLRPYICALPTTSLAPINVNMLDEADAPLVRMLGGARMTDADALRVIRDRPADGWLDPADFWSHEVFAGREIAEEVRASAELRTRYYELRAEISYLGAFLEYSALLEQSPGGETEIFARRFGAAD
ncbi:MAG: type II secretion system minor pseudopilin GspK [Parvularculaceae bacterium]